MKRIIKEQKGFALVITLLGLLVMSILGVTIIGVTTSNYNLTKIDSRSQSTYYIAEAGANYIIDKINKEVQENVSQFETSAEFFQYIEDQFTNDTVILDSFEENYGEQPKAFITISQADTNEDVRDYKIESIGRIGDRKRTVSAILSISWNKEVKNEIIDELIFYAQSFSFMGSTVNAPTGGIIMDGIQTHNLNGNSTLNVSNMYFNGPVTMNKGSASFGSKDNPGNIYVNGDLEFWNGSRDVYGDIRVKGKFRLKDAKVHGNVYVDGDLELGWTPEIHKNIYYTGELIAPDSYNSILLKKCIKVDSLDSFEIPIIDYELREDSWYLDNGYIIKGNERLSPYNGVKREII